MCIFLWGQQKKLCLHADDSVQPDVLFIFKDFCQDVILQETNTHCVVLQWGQGKI